jgi:ActR/RegA family two-component response regulator
MVPSVVDAVAEIEQSPFDLYVVDFNLTHGIGLDVADRIRSKGSEAPIILFSGCDPTTIALRAAKLGIAGDHPKTLLPGGDLQRIEASTWGA